MTNEEMKELDKLIARLQEYVPDQIDSAAAMEVLKKCMETHEIISFYKLLSEETYSVSSVGDGCCTLEPGRKVIAQAATPELAICLFAKKLFAK